MTTFFDALSESFDYLSNYSRTHEYEALECEGTAKHFETTQITLIPAIVMIAIFSFSIRRRNKYLDKLEGRPGILYPINMLTYSERISYVACFGVISSLIYKMVFDSRQAIEYDGHPSGRSFITIVSTLVYGINCFPIFASITLKNALGYGLGTLYIWFFSLGTIYTHVDCELSTGAQFAYNFQSLPQYLSLLYLAIRLPYGFLMEILRWREERTWQREKIKPTYNLLRESYVGQRVAQLLVGVKHVQSQNTDTLEGKVNHWCNRMQKKWVYEWDDGFKYSARILTTMWVCFILIYMITFKCIWMSTSIFLYVTDMARYALDGIKWDNQALDNDVTKLARTLLKLYYYACTGLWFLFIFCFTLSFIISVFTILYSLTSYRKNLKALYCGDNSQIRPISCKTYTGHLMSSLRYTGYQIGYMAWAFLIQSLCIVSFVVTLILVIIILFLGFSDWLAETIYYLGPWFAIFVILLVSQYLLARFVFLQDYENSLSIDNRRSLYVFAYFLFFYNTFVGVGSCLLRIVRSLVTSVLLVARLDQSILPRKYEMKDPGYDRYLGFLYVEAYHTHHCMLVFVDLLKLSHRETRARMLLGTRFTLNNALSKWTARRQKPANQIKKVLEAFIFAKKSASTATANKKNQVDAVNEPPPSVDLAKVVPNWKTNAMQSSKDPPLKSKSRFRVADPTDTTVQLEEPTITTDLWAVIRDSPGMVKYRRKQSASFKWFLAYTLLTNPQLRSLRKGFLQRRMRDAEKGIAGDMTDTID